MGRPTSGHPPNPPRLPSAPHTQGHTPVSTQAQGIDWTRLDVLLHFRRQADIPPEKMLHLLPKFVISRAHTAPLQSANTIASARVLLQKCEKARLNRLIPKRTLAVSDAVQRPSPSLDPAIQDFDAQSAAREVAEKRRSLAEKVSPVYRLDMAKVADARRFNRRRMAKPKDAKIGRNQSLARRGNASIERASKDRWEDSLGIADMEIQPAKQVKVSAECRWNHPHMDIFPKFPRASKLRKSYLNQQDLQPGKARRHYAGVIEGEDKGGKLWCGGNGLMI